jgi:xanthine dehydrogenase accessory factor
MVECCDRGIEFAVAVVLRAEGSTPCKAGAKAIIDASGSVLAGTIGGGAVEAEAQRRGLEAIRCGGPRVFDFHLQGEATEGAEPICGGTMGVLLDPTAARSRPAYADAASARQNRQRGLLLTTVAGSDDPRVAVRFLAESAALTYEGFPGVEALRAALKQEEPQLRVLDSPPARERLEVLVEPLVPKPRLLIVGGGHVGQAVAMQASFVGFEVSVIDDRPEFTRPGLFPEGTTACCGPVEEQLARYPFSPDTYVVLVTRGHQHDAAALRVSLRQPVAYLGMIGSRRKVLLMREDFLRAGWATAAEFDRVYAPIGLDIGSLTVPEIATSIVAQLIAVRRRGHSPRIPLPGGV